MVTAEEMHKAAETILAGVREQAGASLSNREFLEFVLAFLEAWTAFKTLRWSRLRHTTQTLYELTWRVHVAPKWQPHGAALDRHRSG